MSKQYEFGLPADERQRLDHYRAGYRGFKVMFLMTIGGAAIAALVVQDTLMAEVMAVICLCGTAVYAYDLWKAGWVEYVQERAESDGSARGRAWKSALVGGLLAGLLWFFSSDVVEKEPLSSSILDSAVYGVFMALGSLLIEHVIIIISRRRGAANRSGDEQE